MRDLLLPATDTGVLAQVLLIAAVAGAAIYLARSKPEVRILIVGSWLVAFGLIGVRALH